MRTSTIGTTGVEIPSICFGTSALGDMPDTYGYDVSEDRARDTLHAIFDSGVTFLDTSRNYGMGRSEERIGKVIRERGGLPDGFVLATKLDRDMTTGRFDAARARQSLEESLEALQVDRVQIMHLHDPEHARDVDEITQPGGAFDELFRMKEEGLADAVGLAMGRLSLMKPLLRQRPFDVLISHNRWSLLNRSADALFDDAHARGIAILNAAPFAGGVLAKGSTVMPKITYQDADAEGLAPVRQIEEVCARHGLSTAAAALRFSMSDPRIASTIVGVSRPERVAETLALAATDIPQAALADLAALPFDTEDPEAHRVYRPG